MTRGHELPARMSPLSASAVAAREKTISSIDCRKVDSERRGIFNVIVGGGSVLFLGVRAMEQHSDPLASFVPFSNCADETLGFVDPPK